MATCTRRTVLSKAMAILAGLAVGGRASGTPSVLAEATPPISAEGLPDNVDCEASPPNSDHYICKERGTGKRYDCTYHPGSGTWLCTSIRKSPRASRRGGERTGELSPAPGRLGSPLR